MQGVTVIASEVIMKQPDWIVQLIIVSALTSIVFVILARCFVNYCAIAKTFLALVVFAFATLILMSIIKNTYSPDVYDYTKYYVTISDETPMLEFNEKYEVLEKHGDLWEVKEIQEDN